MLELAEIMADAKDSIEDSRSWPIKKTSGLSGMDSLEFDFFARDRVGKELKWKVLTVKIYG